MNKYKNKHLRKAIRKQLKRNRILLQKNKLIQNYKEKWKKQQKIMKLKSKNKKNQSNSVGHYLIQTKFLVMYKNNNQRVTRNQRQLRKINQLMNKRVNKNHRSHSHNHCQLASMCLILMISTNIQWQHHHHHHLTPIILINKLSYITI